ncbi:hypothetical protein V501_03945 [Pseudogymnoascus sp. VKM F-4519 (FW-2642)]|nr:hypothetical protein V501_03945 [Pseudogymnoascus sp. VKM F-4519 (FW-2642)]
MPSAFPSRLPPSFRDKEAELAMHIKGSFNAVAVGDLIQMVPFSSRRDPDIQALVELMQGSDITFANNESTITDRLTFRGPIAHMEADKDVAEDWKNMGIDMVTKANNHTFACGDVGLVQNLEELRRVGIEYVGTDYNTAEARLPRFKTTPKGIIGFIGSYAEVEDYSQLYGLPAGEPITVTPEQLEQLREMRNSIVARRDEVNMPIALPQADPEGAVLVFGRLFKIEGVSDEADAEVTLIKKRMEHYYTTKGDITYKNNSLRLNVYQGVTAEQIKQLRAMAGIKNALDVNTLDAFGIHFRVTPKPGEYTYEMDIQDYRDILREVRSGKQFSEFLSVTIHWHQNRFSFQSYSFDHYPADYQIKFAHGVIDNGADFFFAHGVHTLKGVEIYRGKPIFYGISNFVFQHQQFRSWRDDASGRTPTALEDPIVGDGESNETRWSWLNQPENCEALLVSANYTNGKLSQALLYPVDLGKTPRYGSMIGTPTRPKPEVAQEILSRVAEYSQPFGTTIDIKNGVGIVHVSSE